MAQREYHTLSKRIVDGLSVNGKDAIFWDRDLLGFGVRVYPSGKKVFVVQTRAFGRSKRVTLGEHGNPLTADQVRKDAADVIARIKTGQPAVPPEPAKEPTVAVLAARYYREHVEMHCRPATVTHYRLMLRKHIVPALGERLVAEVEYKDILAFHNSLHHSPTVANRAADILVKMFNLADAWGWRPSGSNPARSVPRFKVEKHERFLTREELYRLDLRQRAAHRCLRLRPHRPPLTRCGGSSPRASPASIPHRSCRLSAPSSTPEAPRFSHPRIVDAGVTAEQWHRIEAAARERQVSPNQLIVELAIEALDRRKWPRTEAEIKVARASLFAAQALARGLIADGRENDVHEIREFVSTIVPDTDPKPS